MAIKTDFFGLSLILLLMNAYSPISIMASDESPIDKTKKPLSGHINKSDAGQLLARPSTRVPIAPPKPGKSLDSSFDDMDKFSFHQNTSSKSLQGGSFIDAKIQSAKTPKLTRANKDFAKTPLVELDLHESVGEDTINWDNWYRQFVQAVYVRFHRADNGEYPGECRVLISVNSEGAVKFSGGEDLNMQSADFRAALSRSINMLNHSSFVAFPEGSQRTEISFTLDVRSSKDDGAGGFGWKQGDNERVKR